VGREWDALHIYIANNLDWMKVWIDRCIQREGRLSWEGVSTLVIEAHRNGDTNLTQQEIDLAHGLKDKQQACYSSNIISLCYFINY
jgi:hypothetical protein